MFRKSIPAAFAILIVTCAPNHCLALPSAPLRFADIQDITPAPLTPEQKTSITAERPAWLNSNQTEVFPAAWWNWIFVSFFAFFGVAQLGLTFYQSRTAGRAASAAKRAADVAQRLVVEFETPFLFPVLGSDTIFESLNQLNGGGNSAVVKPHVSFTIKNFGRTPALLQKVTAVFFYGEMDEGMNDSTPGHITELMLEPMGSLIKPIEREISRPIDSAIFASLKSLGTRIYLRGRITFLDVLGNRYEQIFCFSWDVELGGFVPAGPHRNKRKRLSSGKRRLG